MSGEPVISFPASKLAVAATLSTELLRRVRVVLVSPTHPGNIGAAARAMKNMGLAHLHLVSPRGFPCGEATARAVNAADVLEQAVVHESVDEALAGCSMVVGTSARQRRIPWPLLDLRSCAEKVVDELAAHDQSEIAILFGRESRGLTNEELQRCHYHLNVPCDPEYSSLNLAMSVQLACYELRMTALGREGAALVREEWDFEPAGADDVEHFFDHLERSLVDIGFHDPANPRQLMTRLRRMFMRIRPDKMEISILRGILTSVQQAADPAKDCRGNHV